MDYSTNISFFTGRIIHSVIQLREQRKEDVQIYSPVYNLTKNFLTGFTCLIYIWFIILLAFKR